MWLNAGVASHTWAQVHTILCTGPFHLFSGPLKICCQIYFKEVERRDIAYCTCNFSSFITDVPSFLLVSFLICLKKFLKQLFRAACWQWIPLVFLHLRIIFNNDWNFNFYLFAYFWLGWVFIAACELSLVAESVGYSLIPVHALLVVVTSLVLEHSSRCTGCCSCSMRAQ